MADNSPAGSATRHASTGAISGVLGAVLSVWLAKKGLPVDGDTANQLGTETLAVAGTVGAAVASGIGALWRKFVGE